MEEEYLKPQQKLKPEDIEEEGNEEKKMLEEIRSTPLAIGTLEEFVDENHAIVSESTGPEHYVNIMSFVDKEQLEPGASILMHSKGS